MAESLPPAAILVIGWVAVVCFAAPTHLEDNLCVGGRHPSRPRCPARREVTDCDARIIDPGITLLSSFSMIAR
jgi:hypothetical protein